MHDSGQPDAEHCAPGLTVRPVPVSRDKGVTDPGHDEKRSDSKHDHCFTSSMSGVLILSLAVDLCTQLVPAGLTELGLLLHRGHPHANDLPLDPAVVDAILDGEDGVHV